MAALRTILLTLIFVAACGSLVDEHYLGEPTITMIGHAHDQNAPVSSTLSSAQVGIFWNPHGTVGPFSVNDLVEQPSEGLGIQIPGDFTWSLYDAPPAQEFLTTAGGGAYALGHPMIYFDSNHDGKLEPSDMLLADSPLAAILYAPKALDGQSSPTGFAMSAGYHIVTLPLYCGPPPEEPPHDGDCGVPLGSQCQKDSDCGTGGVCLTTDPFPWPGGYCAIAEPPPSGCRPKNGQLFQSPHAADKSWWVRACTSDADCRSERPYQCDVSRGACLSTKQVPLQFEAPQALRVCAPPPPPMGVVGMGG